MRSEYVFAVAKEINNRFMLCRVASVSARRLQVGPKQPSETINQSLLLIAAHKLRERQGKEESQTNSLDVPVAAIEPS